MHQYVALSKNILRFVFWIWINCTSIKSYLKLLPTDRVYSIDHILWMSIWLKRINISRSSPIPVFMKPRLSHSSIRVYILKVDIIHSRNDIVDCRRRVSSYCLWIKSSCCSCIIYSAINCEVLFIQPWIWSINVKQAIPWQIHKLNIVPIISCLIDNLWIARITYNRLYRIINGICTQLHWSYIIRQAKLLPSSCEIQVFVW